MGRKLTPRDMRIRIFIDFDKSSKEFIISSGNENNLSIIVFDKDRDKAIGKFKKAVEGVLSAQSVLNMGLSDFYETTLAIRHDRTFYKPSYETVNA